jgi:dTDP-4-amino-4,6-dideoxygalactose transaminase
VIPLAIPNISGNEATYLMECVRTNFVSSVGPFVTRLEQMTAEATGATACAATSSGTTGLHAALMAVGVAAGDLVLLPSFTFIASANAVAHCHATPWFVDISPESWCMNPLQLADLLAEETGREGKQLIHRATGHRVAAIMPVYTLGTPADMDPILALAREHGLPVVADAAAALGARYKGRNLAGLADLSVASFNGNKTVTAGGGGAIVGADDTVVKLVRHLTTTARVGDDYDHDRVGYNYRMTNLQAAVGCAQLERLDEFVTAKRRIRARYDQALAGLPGVKAFPQPAWAESACWFSGLVLDDPALPTARELCAELRRRDIGARTFWRPAHLQVPYRDAPRAHLPVTESTWDKVVTLPCSTQLSEVDQTLVIAAVQELLLDPARSDRP